MFVFRIQQAWKHLVVVLDHSRPCAAACSRRQLWWHLECCSSHRARQTPQRSACRSPGIQALQLQAEAYAYAQVEKLLENEHLEKDQRINPLAS
jgi:hypothetical protein